MPAVSELLPRARAAGVLVVFVRLAFRANGADVPGEPFATYYRAGEHFHEGSRGTEVAFEVASDDVVVLTGGEPRLSRAPSGQTLFVSPNSSRA